MASFLAARAEFFDSAESFQLQLPIQNHSRPITPQLLRSQKAVDYAKDSSAAPPQPKHEATAAAPIEDGTLHRDRREIDEEAEEPEPRFVEAFENVADAVAADEEAASQSDDELRDPYDQEEENRLHARYIKEARTLGLSLPPEPKTLMDLIARGNASEVTVSSSVRDETNTLTSQQASPSTRPTSFNSSVQHFPSKGAACHTTDRASIVTSNSGSQSVSESAPLNSYHKFRKSIRRLSTLTRKRSSGLGSPAEFRMSVSTNAESLPRPSISSHDAEREFGGEKANGERKSIAILLPALSEVRVSNVYPTDSRLASPVMEEVPVKSSIEMLAAQERSFNSEKLLNLRGQHLEEKARFLQNYKQQLDRIRNKYDKERDQIEDNLDERQAVLREQHVARNIDLETRHLAAELELARQLEGEKKACETRLKHMEAYCNNGTPDPDGPREVDEDEEASEQSSLREDESESDRGKEEKRKRPMSKSLLGLPLTPSRHGKKDSITSLPPSSSTRNLGLGHQRKVSTSSLQVPGPSAGAALGLGHRKITSEDLRKLNSQRHLVSSLNALHASRIHVLREQQARQLERVAARQRAELDAEAEVAGAEREGIDAAQLDDERRLDEDMVLRRARMVWRWGVVERVARRKAEIEEGLEEGDYAPLPEVEWNDEPCEEAA